MTKSIFIVIVSLLIFILMTGVVWFFFFYDRPEGEFDFSTAVSDFLPFGRLGETDGTGNEPGQREEEEETTEGETFGALRQLVAAPVAGFTVLQGTTTVVRYIERGTGHVFDFLLPSGRPERVTNTTIPRIHEALFADSGSTVLVRYLRDDNATIETYSAKIPEPTGAPGELKGTFLTADIADLVPSPDSKKIFYLLSFGGGTTGFTASSENSAPVQVFTSLANEWLSSWANDRTITVTTKPSGGIAGSAYAVDPISKSFEKLVGGISGLTVLMSPDGAWLFYGSAENRGLGSAFYDVKNKDFLSSTIATIADKCAWTKTGNMLYCGVPATPAFAKYPDSWYQGLVLFSDRLWRIDPVTGEDILLADPRREAGVPIDAIKLSFSNDGNYLFFVNKKDQSLWSLDLAETEN